MGPNDSVVAQLWRYPVKSMQGERLPVVEVQADGLDGDRRWGVRDERTGRVLTGRREATLLEATASLGEGAEPVIKLPDGTGLIGAGDATDSALSDWLGRPVRLVEAAAHGDRAEYFADPTDDASEAIEWTMPPERFVDAMPLPACGAANSLGSVSEERGDSANSLRPETSHVWEPRQLERR